MARLRLGKTFLDTRPSTRCSVSRSMVIATLTLLMDLSPWYDNISYPPETPGEIPLAARAPHLTREAIRDRLQVGFGQFRVVAAIEAASVDEVGAGQLENSLGVLDIERLALDVAGDHGPHLDPGIGKAGKVFIAHRNVPAQYREGETGQQTDVIVLQRYELGVALRRRFEAQMVPLSLLESLGHVLQLMQPDEPGDLGGPQVVAEVVENVFRLEFAADAEPLAPFLLLRRREVAVPAVGSDDAEHLGEVFVVGARDPSLDRGHVMGDVEREARAHAEIAGSPGGKLGAEGFAVILDQQDRALPAEVADSIQIAGKAERVGDEQRLNADRPGAFLEIVRHHVQRLRVAIDGDRLHAELDDRHGVRGPGQAREAHCVAVLQAREVLERLEHGEIGASAAVEEDGVLPPLQSGERLLELAALGVHTEPGGRNDEFGERLLCLGLAQERALHQRNHEYAPFFFSSRYRCTTPLMPSASAILVR